MKRIFYITIKIIVMILFVSVTQQTIAQKVTMKNNWGQHGATLLDQSSQGIKMNFSVQEYTLSDTKVEREVMNTITMKGVLLQNSEGAPNLPGYSRYIAVPQGAQVKASIVRKQSEIFENMEIAPAPRIPLDTEKGPLSFKKNSDIYSINSFYPENIIQVSEPMKIRGVDVVIIAISPFQYNPVTKQLIVNKDIEIDVEFEGGNGQFGDERLASRFWDPIIRDAVINEASIPTRKVTNVNTQRSTGSEYIIIVPDDPAYLSWADSIRIFRLKQGISTQVVTTTEIGGNTSTAIEDYINNAYNTWDVPPAATLLMADWGSSGNTIYAPKWDNYCITDNFYADVDNDMMPDVIFARMTAQNETHLETMVTKFLNYERNPPTNPGFYDNPITAMGWQTERWFQICSEVIAGFFENSLNKSPVRENAIYSGSTNTWSTAQNTQTILDYFGESGLNYIPDSPGYLTDWGGNATRVNNDINSGAFLLQHRDHGSETGWGEPAYSSGDIDGLYNTDLVYIFSINCLTGKFDISGECFAEKFHRYRYNGVNSGALGIMAATEVSYSFVNDTYTWGIYDNMWPDFMPDYGTTPEHRGVLPAFGNAAGKYFLKQSSWPYNTNNKEVTYYLFHHHGDAFSTIYTQVPQNLTAIHDDIILSGLDFFTIQANDGATICMTVGEEVIGLAEGTGSPIDMPIIPQEPGIMIDLVITLQDYYRYETTIEVIPPDGPYCMYASHTINDTLGNSNGIVEFDEDILYTLTMKNLGIEDAIDVDVTLVTDEFATFIDDTENYDTILMNSYVTRDYGYKLHISDGIPDQYQLNFEVIASDENDSTWTSNFYTVVDAPIITPGEMVIDDSQTGNDNGRLDPGENVDMIVKMSNPGHCAIDDVICNITAYNPYITVNSGTQTIPTLGIGIFGATQVAFNVTVADDAPNAIIAEMLFNASAAGYSVDENYYPKIGVFLEDWETGDFSKYNWVHDGDEQWEITNQYPWEGNFHARSSSTLGDGKTSEFKITYNVMANDQISFYKKISSEANADELIFYIDNTEVASWSGAESWTHETFPVTPGNHTFRWVYSKDYGGTSGLDCAWIDYIELPTMLVTTVFAGPDDQTCEENQFQCVGSATNHTSALWTTSGDGTFDFPEILQPKYTAGPQDIINGNVDLTLTIEDPTGESYDDEMILTLVGGPEAPEMPMGPDYVDVYKTIETEYSVNKVNGATGYTWLLEPEEAGILISIDTFAVVQWNNAYLGEALLSIVAENQCGEGTYSEVLTIDVDNTVGLWNIENADFSVKIIPNPNNGIFDVNIISDDNKNISLSLVNYLGIEIFKKENIEAGNGFVYHMNNTSLPAGVYILNIEHEGTRYGRKILIGR